MRTRQTKPGNGGGILPRTALTAALTLCVVGVVLYLAWIEVLAPRRGPVAADGAVDFDVEKARAETEALGQQMSNAISSGQVQGYLMAQVRGLVDRYPRYGPAHTLLGQAYWQAGQKKEAYDAMNMSLQINPAQPEVQELAGTMAMGLERMDRAGWHFGQAITYAPAEPRYRLALANVYLRERDFDKARTLLLECIRLDSDQHRAYSALSDVFAQQNKMDLALEQIQRAMEHTPAEQHNTFVLYGRKKASLLRRDNKPQEAMQVLLALGEEAKNEPQVLADMGTCWMMLSKPAEAAVMYREAFARQPIRWELAAEAARYFIKAGDVAAAQEMLEQVRTLQPQAQVLRELQSQITPGTGSAPGTPGTPGSAQ
ncbi:MAG: tetratricopeptide repeat protein [Phycisphaeraceae bacterium]|nr:tetratricopeptide repeat protein [Phycisphaeraceae bacterium]